MVRGGVIRKQENKLRLRLCQAYFKLKVELRLVLQSAEVEIEAEIVLKSCILYFCGRVAGWLGGGGVEKLRLKLSQLTTKLKLKLKLSLAICDKVHYE